MKKNVFLSMLCSCVCALALSVTDAYGDSLEQSGWVVYENKKYGYEIKYPDGYQLVVAGLEPERDGSRFSVVIEGRTLAHGIHCEIRKNQTLEQIAAAVNAPSLQEFMRGPVSDKGDTNKSAPSAGIHEFYWEKVNIGGLPAIKGEVRFSKTGELFFLTIIMDSVLFQVDLYPDAGLDAKKAEDIILTFKFKK